MVDLGKSSGLSEQAWSEQYGCPVLRADSFRQGIADVKRVRQIFSIARGRLLDEEGLDWWDLTSLLVVPEALTLLALDRVAAEIPPSAELCATRPGWPAATLAALAGRTCRSFGQSAWARSAARGLHYASFIRRFSAGQTKEIFLDKYDAGYRWRSRVTPKPRRCSDPVVLLPSAYGNVSRTGSAYARLLPQQSFLMVATRQSAKQFAPPANVQVRDLAAYARAEPSTKEMASLVQRWFELRADLDSTAESRMLSQAGILEAFPSWIRDGIGARNAWRDVIEREPVCGVLCGDDSNLYTRLPVLLAARRKIPTVDFHHGAFDGRYLLKDLPCDVYLAKNEMERDYLSQVCGLPSARIMIGAPPRQARAAQDLGREDGGSAIFFSEPYEAAGMRADEVYREILPALCRVAGEHGRNVIVKLHPFENRSQRCRMIRDILSSADQTLVTVLDGPLTNELLSKAWFGITVESTTVMDCLEGGVCCFLCGWLTLSPYEYAQQYSRFGVGEVLQSAEQIGDAPSRLQEFRNRRATAPNLSQPIDPAMLQQWLTSGLREPSGARSAS
ncbi:MAG: hypothetical protein ACLP72_06950 [Candidatus Sulfotelmatobacter sp.]